MLVWWIKIINVFIWAGFSSDQISRIAALKFPSSSLLASRYTADAKICGHFCINVYRVWELILSLKV